MYNELFLVYLKVKLKTKTNLVCMIKLAAIPLKIYYYLITAIKKAQMFQKHFLSLYLTIELCLAKKNAIH